MNVTKKTHPIQVCKDYVTELVQTRKEAHISQQFMAEWLGVSRKKINKFENGDFDFELFCKYCEHFSINILIRFEE